MSRRCPIGQWEAHAKRTSAGSQLLEQLSTKNEQLTEKHVLITGRERHVIKKAFEQARYLTVPFGSEREKKE